MRRLISVLLRLCVVATLLGFMIHFHFIDLPLLLQLLWRPEVMILGAGAIFASYTTGALRWWLLLRSQRLELDYTHIFQLYAISIFSSAFIPGGTGSSDAVRVLMLTRAVPAYRGQAILAVFGDRFIAILMLAVLASILTLVQWPLATNVSPMFWLSLCAVVLPAALVLIALAGWLITRKAKVRIDDGVTTNRWLVQAISVMSQFLDLSLKQWRKVIVAMAASAATTILALFSIVIVSRVAAFPNLSGLDVAEVYSGGRYGHADTSFDWCVIRNVLHHTLNLKPSSSPYPRRQGLLLMWC